MDVIKVMDVNLSNKIAAGEVVEKLMNVVKELVENSIDANSSTIKVELIDSGIKMIKVIDDGCGMNKNDAKLCLERHATSKIYTDEDLFNINTLGFRGEAIPSIASVSNFLLKTSDGVTGTEIFVSGGVIKEIKNSDLRKGTEITVSDIFFNTPARYKYLKSLYTELANIVDYVNKMALSFPNISFTLINNDKTLLNTDGSGNLLKVISNIYGISVAKKMVSIKNSDDDYEVSGYISYPENARSSKNNITILVNGRCIRNTLINRCIVEAYHTYIPKDKYPIVVIKIDCDTSLVDVNVHPTKMDVKISKIDNLLNLITDCISNTLEKLTLIPEVKYENRPISNLNEVTTINNEIDFKEDEKKEYIEPKFEDLTFDFTYEVKENEVSYEKSEDEKFKMINPVALIHGTYIIGENEDGMYIMDQHAVNERINYEYYLKEMGKETIEATDLLVPIKLEFSNKEYLILKQNFNILRNINIGFEEFGNNTIIIRSHPNWIKKDYVEESLRKIIEVIIEEESFSKEKFNEKIATTLACKMSIKANEYVSLEELKVLIERLRQTNNPFTCPHGRPTIISYSIYELEKLFKRVMQ